MTGVDILVFAGTYEGRMCCQTLGNMGLNLTVCVATEYGRDLLKGSGMLTVISRRMDSGAMKELMRTKPFRLVIDATHPYALEVTDNIRAACSAAGIPYLRLLREEKRYEEVETVDSAASAVRYLAGTKGAVLLTTGSKELAAYCELPDYRQRLYARVLPSPDVLGHCRQLGLEGRHIIAMQGPFSHTLNAAMIREFGCRYVVTKNTGDAGGLDEKISAARETGAQVLLVCRPVEESGLSYEAVLHEVCRRFCLSLPSLTSHSAQGKFFPLFVDSRGKRVLVVGGGAVAERRIKALKKFDFGITLVSPQLTPFLEELVLRGALRYREREFEPQDIAGNDIILAATNIREVNARVGRLAQERGLYVSVADCKEECSFFFPAVVVSDKGVVGVTSGGRDHWWVREAASKIRGVLP